MENFGYMHRFRQNILLNITCSKRGFPYDIMKLRKGGVIADEQHRGVWQRFYVKEVYIYMLRRIILIMMIISLSICSISFSAAANPDGPVVIGPSQYGEVLPIGTLPIIWSAPPQGVVAGYSLGIRELSIKGETSNILVVNWPQLSATTTSYTVPAGTIKAGGAYRLSVCATMNDGTQKWSDEIYFYGADCCGVRYNSILSFRIWTGFDLGIKNATYYSTLTWEPVLDKPFVNTYAYDQGVSSEEYSSYDSVNTVIPGYEMDDTTLMVAHVRSGTYIDEVDIEINMNQPWSYYGEAGSFDAQAVMTHEMGHALGLIDKYDSFASEWTMYGYISTGETKKRSLHEVDIAALRDVYGHL